ncbi:hypothetical protein VULLAG_LOCUS17555 [Vulpes lagopus]
MVERQEAPSRGCARHRTVLAALDRDAACRKQKLRQKLEQIIGLASGNG